MPKIDTNDYRNYSYKTGAITGTAVGTFAGLAYTVENIQNSPYNSNIHQAKALINSSRNKYIFSQLKQNNIGTLEGFLLKDEAAVNARKNFRIENMRHGKLKMAVTNAKLKLKSISPGDKIEYNLAKKELDRAFDTFIMHEKTNAEAMQNMKEIVSERRQDFLNSDKGKLFRQKIEEYKSQFKFTDSGKKLYEFKESNTLMLRKSIAKWVLVAAAIGTFIGLGATFISSKIENKNKQSKINNIF